MSKTYPEGTSIEDVTVHPSIQWVKYDDLVDIDTEIEAEVELLTDHNYGADADGNRGVVRTFINLVVLNSMRIRPGGRDGGREWMQVAASQGEIQRLLTEKEYSRVLDDVCDEVMDF